MKTTLTVTTPKWYDLPGTFHTLYRPLQIRELDLPPMFLHAECQVIRHVNKTHQKTEIYYKLIILIILKDFIQILYYPICDNLS